MKRQRVRVLRDGLQEQVQRLARGAVGGEIAPECEPGAPVLRVGRNQPPAQLGEAIRARIVCRIRAFEAADRQVRAIGRPLDELLPGRDRRRGISLQEALH